MAGQFDVHNVVVTLPIGGSVVTPVFKNPTDNGKISIIEAYIIPGGAGTMTATLVTVATGGCTTASAVVDATLGTFGSAANVSADGSAATCTIATPEVDENHWVAVSSAAGTLGANSRCYISYVKGIAGD